MDIKCNYHHYSYNDYIFPRHKEKIPFRGMVNESVCRTADIIVKRPIATECAIGLSSKSKISSIIAKIQNYFQNYKKNLQHTIEHKIFFAMVEKSLYGNISINSITHDLDKLIMYFFGMPRSFVSKFHREHSEHHPQSGKKMNFRTMLCDMKASEFKPDKSKALREYFNTCPELQRISGLQQYLEKYNYGENLSLESIKAKKERNSTSIKALSYLLINLLPLM